MAKPFHELRERLLQAGVAPQHVRRYLTELADHLADLTAEEERAGRSRANAESAALIRLGGMDELANAMIEQRQFQSWCARAPWATFGLVPILLLALAWLIALFILWSGWQIFLPGADTPFGAPILIGWGIGLVAARQRLKAVWPAIGLVLVAWMGGAAQVHAGRTAVPHGLGHISMSFALAPTVHGGPFGLLQMLLLPMAALPYVIWRLLQARSLSA